MHLDDESRELLGLIKAELSQLRHQLRFSKVCVELQGDFTNVVAKLLKAKRQSEAGFATTTITKWQRLLLLTFPDAVITWLFLLLDFFDLLRGCDRLFVLLLWLDRFFLAMSGDGALTNATVSTTAAVV